MVIPELGTPGLQTQCLSYWAIQLKSYCGEGVEFVHLFLFEGGGGGGGGRVEQRILWSVDKRINHCCHCHLYCIIIYLSCLNFDWLLVREVQLLYWTQKLLVAVEIFIVRLLKVRLELESSGLQTKCSSDWAIQLKSYCWEGVECIQFVYCNIIYLSFLNCDWLLIREVQWFYWTEKLLVPIKKLTVRMPEVRFWLATTGLQT